ncbi:xanthine dehydrogenase family protein subunit M [Rhizobium sp. TH2]|uniref:FAD binding domain-containing protein n=1 Tax=Rhizobium sp. TH2 TaxID=2775403 RepID=UPI002157960D|nr:FAD binding domain-containing protein [Rhizobium sp. TH2]
MTIREFIAATSVEQAVSALTDHAGASLLAGATWTMRARLRGEDLPETIVSISGIAELGEIQIGVDRLSIGACVTHAGLAVALAASGEFQGLADAARQSANPAVRSMATVGGNLCTHDFAAADLVPALLCLDAMVEYRSAQGVVVIGLEEFLQMRMTLGPGLVTGVSVPRGKFRSAHARLPLRKAGDYPVAIVSVKADRHPDGTFHEVHIAVGSVEPAARRWYALENAIEGRALAPSHMGAMAGEISKGFSGRDGIEAPGWYRVQVLPVLVRRAFEDLCQQGGN